MILAAWIGPGRPSAPGHKADGNACRPKDATVTAESPMNTYVLSVSEFRSLLDVSPTILRHIATSLAQRLRALEAHYPH